MYLLLLAIIILFYLFSQSSSLLYSSQIKSKGGFYSCTFTPYTDTSYMITGINRDSIIDSENDIRDVIMQRYL
jgi:hypothetical protein